MAGWVKGLLGGWMNEELTEGWMVDRWTDKDGWKDGYKDEWRMDG